MTVLEYIGIGLLVWVLASIPVVLLFGQMFNEEGDK
jgi:uncharacterized membrane protein